MPTADATMSVPTPTATEATPACPPSSPAREDRPCAELADVSEPRWRRWYREALLDAQLVGLALVMAVMIGLVAAVV